MRGGGDVSMMKLFEMRILVDGGGRKAAGEEAMRNNKNLVNLAACSATLATESGARN